MTVKELIMILQQYVESKPERADYTVKMVGHDANGERLYDIDVDEVTTDSAERVLHLWDE